MRINTPMHHARYWLIQKLGGDPRLQVAPSLSKQYLLHLYGRQAGKVIFAATCASQYAVQLPACTVVSSSVGLRSIRETVLSYL